MCIRFFLVAGLLAVRWAAAQPTPARRVAYYYYDAARTRLRTVVGIRVQGRDTVLHGPYRRYWPTGTLAETGHFTNGQADSTWTRYYPTGQLARRLPMQAGRPHGPFLVLHPNGQLAQRGTYQRGRLLDSLVSRTATGQPRLLARLVADSAGLAGRFVQWRSGITAQPLARPESSSESLTYDNPYPAADTGRYWTGQLAGGRFAGVLAEHDADGQLRVRLLYVPAGRVRLATRYYPAAWLTYELRYAGLLDSSQVAHSRPRWQGQWLGRDLLYQYFDWTSEDGQPEGEAVIRPVVGPHLSPPTTCLTAPLPPLAPPPGQPRPLSAAEAFNPFRRTGPQDLPVTPSKYRAAADKYYQQTLDRRLREGRTQHLLGHTDTLTGQFVRERQRVEGDSTGRTVTTATTRREYNPDGSLASTARKTRRYKLARAYEQGRLVEYRKEYYHDDRLRLRRWDGQGRLQYDSRTTRHGTTYARRRDREGHLPPRRTLERPTPRR